MSWQDDPVVSSSGQDSWQSDPVVEEPSKLETFGHATVNNFPFGGQGAAVAKGLMNDKGYSENLEDWNKQTDIDKTANPKTYGAGAVTGAIAPLFLPGVGEAMEAAPIATNAAMGAASAAGNTDLLKNPKEAIKQAVVGGGISGATAGILGKIFPKTGTLENFAERKAIQSAEIPNVGDMTPSERSFLGKFMQENDLVGTDKAKVLEKARSLSDGFGSKIGEIADKSEEAGLHLDPETHMSKIDDLLQKAEQFKGSANREAKALARDYTAGASDILNLSDNPTWNQIQKLKEQYGPLAFDSKGEIKSEGAKDTYFALKDMLKSIAEKAQDSNLAPEYKQALLGYSTMQPIESALEKVVSSDFKGGAGMGVRGAIGLIKKLPGAVRAIAGPAAAMMGHPFLGAAAALPELTNPAIQSKVASGMANVAKKLPISPTQSINQMIHDYLINQFQKKKEK